MKRTLIKQGGSGLTVYLPKTWIDERGLKAGDEVDIEPQGAQVIISTDTSKEEVQTFEITAANRKDVSVLLTHAYRRGVNKILCSGLTAKDLREIKNITKELLLGFELTEETTNSCTIETLSITEQERYEQMVRRLFLMVGASHELITNRIDKKEATESLSDVRSEFDRTVLFCKRLIAKQQTQTKSLYEWEFLSYLLLIQHGYYYLDIYLNANKIKSSKKIDTRLSTVKRVLDLQQKAYYQKDREAIHTINNMKEKWLEGEFLKELEKMSGVETIISAKLIEILRYVQVSTSPLLSLLL